MHCLFVAFILVGCQTTTVVDKDTKDQVRNLRVRVGMLEQMIEQLRADVALIEATPNDELPLCIDTD